MEQEPSIELEKSNEFTREELMFIHMAICSDAVNHLLPPRDEDKLRLSTSVTRKIFNKLEEDKDV